MSTAAEIRRLAKRFKELEDSRIRYDRITDQVTKSAKISDETKARIMADSDILRKDILRRKVASFGDLDLLSFDEKENRELYDEAIIHIESAIKSVKSPFQKLIKESSVDYYDIAKRIYDAAKNGIAEGEPIPLSTLLNTIEAVTNGIGKLGLNEMKRRKPFFF
jgi:hypothetical protein